MSPEERHDEEQRQEARARVERIVNGYLARGRYRLNPDPVTVQHVLVGLTNNLLHHGRAYCPCRPVTGDPVRDRDNLCPCPQHPADIARVGACECGIFVAADFAGELQTEETRG